MSQTFDPLIFAALGILVLAAHSLLLGPIDGSTTLTLLTSTGLGVGLAGYLFWNPLFIVLVGVTGLAMMFQDGKSINSDPESPTPLSVFLLAFLGVFASAAVLGVARWVAGASTGHSI